MKDFEPRIPQQEAFDSFFNYYKKGGKGNPLIAMQTGLGKSYVVAMILIEMIKTSKAKVLVVTHSEKVLSQDYQAFYDLLCHYNIYCTLGKYSAKLGLKELGNRVTFASINSIYRKPELFDVNYLFVDEAHLISDNEDTMYRKLITALDVKVCGLTATPFRTGKGYLHKMENGIFTDLIYDTNTPEKFAEMIELGYIVKPVRDNTSVEMDVSKIKKTGGDFNLKGLSLKLDREELTTRIVDDLMRYKDSHKHWMVFAIDKKHCENISEELNKRGIKSDFVHSTKNEDTDEAIKEFRDGNIQALVSVMMLTTGVDIPTIDVIVMMRPTSSVVIHIQSIGRGLRTNPGKTECLILDYAGNVARNGPIDNPIIKVKGKGKKGGEMTKTCPSCELKHHISVRICECGHEFTFEERLEINSGELSIIKEKVKVWRKVDEAYYYIHSKPGKPDSLRIEYLCGLRRFPMWITLYHGGSASRNSNHVFGRLKKESFTYNNIGDIISNKDKLRTPSEIYIDETEKYPHIEDFKFERL